VGVKSTDRTFHLYKNGEENVSRVCRWIFPVVFGVWGLVFLTWLIYPSDLDRPISEGMLRVNLNTATMVELQSIPGIGPSFASLIRNNRPYRDVEEISKLPGFGKSKVQVILPMLKVEGPTEFLVRESIGDRFQRRLEKISSGNNLLFFISGVGLLFLLSRVLGSWCTRFQNRKRIRSAMDAERRRWEGHRLSKK
jgi:hypothetical protein